MKSQMGCAAVVLAVLYLFGIWLFGHSLLNARRSTQAADWPTTTGTITELSVQEKSDDEGMTYEVKVRYAYAVEGTSYEGARLAFGYGGSSGRKAHDEIYRKLGEAKSVAVRYDPADPSVSCLSYGVHRSIQIKLAFSVAWLAFLIGVTLVLWRLSQSDRVLLDNLSVQ